MADARVHRTPSGPPGSASNTNADRWQKFGHAVQWGNNASEAQAAMLMRTAGTWSNISIKILTNTRDDALTGKSRINGVDGNQSVTVPASTTGTFTDAVNTDSIAAGNKINYEIFSAHSTSTTLLMTIANWTSHYAASSGDPVYRLTSVFNSNNMNANTQEWLSVCQGETLYAVNEAFIQQYVPAEGGTLKNAYANVSAALGGSTGVVLTMRVNAVNSALTMTLPPATSGDFEDVANSVAVVEGDLISWGMVSDATIHSVRALACDFTTTGFYEGSTKDSAGITLVASAGDWRADGYGLLTGFHAGTITENHASILAGIAFSWNGLRWYVNSNGQDGDCVWYGRINGVNTGWSGTTPATTTGAFTTTGDAESVAATDLINIRRTASGTSGTALVYFTHNIIGSPAAPVVPPVVGPSACPVPVVAASTVTCAPQAVPSSAAAAGV